MSAAAVAAGAMAVESANTVGTQSQAIVGDQWYLVGIQFEEVGSDAGTIAFDDLLTMNGVTAAAYDDQETDAAQIQYFNGVGYDFLYYISDAYDATDKDVGHDCWAIDGYETTANKKNLGEGFWLKVPAVAIPATATMNIKGQVVTNPTKTVDFTANTWKIISNPFPVALGLQNVTTTGVTAAAYDDQEKDAAQIQYFNGVGYDFYYYISDAYDATDNDVGHDCWAIDGYITTGTQIPAGSAFWFKAKQSGSMTFTL